MVKFDSLLDGGSALCAPMVHGSFVLWFASGSCARVSASCASLASVARICREWSECRDSVVSVSFWVGSLLVCRAFGGFALALGACSFSECWRARCFVS